MKFIALPFLGSKKDEYADFVILDKNPLTLPSTEIRNINVFQAIVNGNTVFKR
jgi:predicted amidohydrolase YtcJ|tara:strand:- start:17187 stop:17345 length:159 start_codon:yes stop_codon:yes gene_type:complete